MRYVAQDRLDEAAEAYRNGVSLETLAASLQVSECDLQMLLGLTKTAPDTSSDDFDLWSCDRVSDQL